MDHFVDARQSHGFGHAVGRAPESGVRKDEVEKMFHAGVRKTVDKFPSQSEKRIGSENERGLLNWKWEFS